MENMNKNVLDMIAIWMVYLANTFISANCWNPY